MKLRIPIDGFALPPRCAGLSLLLACALLLLAPLAAAPARAAGAAEALTAAEPSWEHRPEAPALELARQVEIRRTEYGVVHIFAENLRAAGFAMGFVQAEDYGSRVMWSLIASRGDTARIVGRSHLNRDTRNRERYLHAVETYHLVPEDVRAIHEGFAEGVNHFIRSNPDQVPEWAEPVFTGHDVAARDMGWYNASAVAQFLQQRQAVPDDETDEAEGDIEGDDGSNAFALAPSRTTSGHTILMRNPHLGWDAGYYEAHIRVPGVLDFYGDFRIGGPFSVIGGFNRHLGWATTNNSVRRHEIYALAADPDRPDHFLFDGQSVPISRRQFTLTYRDGEQLGRETREMSHSPLGPVIHRDDEHVYIIRDASHGRYQAGEQWLRMMQAENLEQWLDAMRLRGRSSSNFTYADRDGNILLLWNGTIPDLPHPVGNDRNPRFVSRSDEIWTELVPLERLPMVLNPPGGYVRNENDSPHYANMHRVLDPRQFPPNVQGPRKHLRSQLGVELLHNEQRFSLEDAWRLKHNKRMMVADRIKDELLAAVRQSGPSAEVAAAADLLEEWDNTAARDSRGAVLFAQWWELYRQQSGGAHFREGWSADDPLGTPRGLRAPETAVAAFVQAVAQVREQFDSWDVPWGEVHRVRRGEVDVPVGGGSNDLGFYRIVGYRTDPDGRRRARGGDGWVLAVEFSDPPRAFSVLAYGQSNRPESPHYSDQAEMFAANGYKEVAFTEEQIRQRMIRRYHPGLEELPLPDR